MTLLAFAADRRAAVDMDRNAAAPAAAIDQYRQPAGHIAANPPHAAAAGERDRQADRYILPLHTHCIYTVTVPHIMRAAAMRLFKIINRAHSQRNNIDIDR